MTHQKRYTRKKILIDSQSQFRFTLITSLSLLVIGVLLVLTIYLPVYLLTYQARDNVQFSSRQFDVNLLESKIIPLTLVYLICVAIFTIYHTHKIFGPVFRFQETLKRMGRGEFNFRITLRQHDYLKGLQHNFNDFLDVMNTRLGPAKKTFQDMQAEVHSLQSLMTRNSVTTNEIGTSLDNIGRHLSNLEILLDGFQLDETRDPSRS